jgi:hypothetical protein
MIEKQKSRKPQQSSVLHLLLASRMKLMLTSIKCNAVAEYNFCTEKQDFRVGSDKIAYFWKSFDGNDDCLSQIKAVPYQGIRDRKRIEYTQLPRNFKAVRSVF